MSAHEEGTEGSSSMSRPSSVVPNIYVPSEAIRSSMENSMELLSAIMKKNALVMAATIREGFAARPSIEGTRDDSLGHRTNVLGTWRGRLVLPKWW